jgi:hypothetical protein
MSQVTFGATVGLAAAAISGSSLPLSNGITIQAAAANLDKVYIGLSSGVTAGTVNATDGVPLNPGQNIFIPCQVGGLKNANQLFGISPSAAQKVYCITS